MYSKKTLNSYFFKTRGFYFMFAPLSVPYKEIYAKAEAAGLRLKEAGGPILESGKFFGFGWIGVEVEKPTDERLDVELVQGDFEAFEYKGPYKSLGRAYKKLMKEQSCSKKYLNLYLDDPQKVAPENCRTQILFR